MLGDLDKDSELLDSIESCDEHLEIRLENLKKNDWKRMASTSEQDNRLGLVNMAFECSVHDIYNPKFESEEDSQEGSKMEIGMIGQQRKVRREDGDMGDIVRKMKVLGSGVEGELAVKMDFDRSSLWGDSEDEVWPESDVSRDLFSRIIKGSVGSRNGSGGVRRSVLDWSEIRVCRRARSLGRKELKRGRQFGDLLVGEKREFKELEGGLKDGEMKLEKVVGCRERGFSAGDKHAYQIHREILKNPGKWARMGI